MKATTFLYYIIYVAPISSILGNPLQAKDFTAPLLFFRMKLTYNVIKKELKILVFAFTLGCHVSFHCHLHL